MNRQEYQRTNRILRNNGKYALRWLSSQQLVVWEYLLSIKNSVDPLAERASIIEYCKREGISCDLRHTRHSN